MQLTKRHYLTHIDVGLPYRIDAAIDIDIQYDPERQTMTCKPRVFFYEMLTEAGVEFNNCVPVEGSGDPIESEILRQF